MKLFLIIGSIIFFSNMAKATPIITPTKNERSFALVENDKLIMGTARKNSNSSSIPWPNACKYNFNDYRMLKNSEVGCAVNNNIEISISNGDICN